jgi:hypothetical protein
MMVRAGKMFEDAFFKLKLELQVAELENEKGLVGTRQEETLRHRGCL